jgi:uncharacterized protein YndB with AHSA1/START domain
MRHDAPAARKVAAQLATYRTVLAAKPMEMGAFERQFFNHMILVLDRYFVHRGRTMEGKGRQSAQRGADAVRCDHGNERRMRATRSRTEPSRGGCLMPDTAAATRSVIVEREMPHPPDKIWRALTQGPLIEEWLMKNDFQPVVGQRFNFRATPMPHWNGIVDCQVLVVEPNERLSYSWNTSGAEAADGLKTIVTWTLTPRDGGTHVRIEQSGFRPEDEANYQGARYGWQRFVPGLERVVTGLG